MMTNAEIKFLLDEKVAQFNNPDFIDQDPICIPHQFSKKQDIEIAGFLAATFAWGQRKTIINKSLELLSLMDNAPYDFVTNHSEEDLKPLVAFKHRTFNDVDCLYFVDFLHFLYSEYNSMEDAFLRGDLEDGNGNIMEKRLIAFHNYFFSRPDFPLRTMKHVATPARNSACKRINMFLRWMVRKDNGGVDFGIWKRISSADLICPLDLHVDKIARRIGLINRKQSDWKTAVALTEKLSGFDPLDPVKYDFALFGMGVIEKY
jgi:uncharacterized protein (TIGR02757 family)